MRLLEIAITALLTIACRDANGIDTLGPGSCDFRVDADSETVGRMARAVELWDDALPGCDISMATDGSGVRVRQKPELGSRTIGEKVYRIHGQTERIDWLNGTWTPSIELVPEAGVSAALHELGHALAGRHGHTESGLMGYPSNGSEEIDHQALLLVCGAVPCGLDVPALMLEEQ